MRDAWDEPYARLNNEITSMKTAIGDLSQRTTDAVGDFGVVAWKQARRGVRNARESVDSAVANAADAAARLRLPRHCKPRRLATRYRARSRSARCRQWLSPYGSDF